MTTDYFAIYANLGGKRHGERHICNVVARDEAEAVRIAKAQGLSLRERGRGIYAVRIGKAGYAKLLAAAGFTVETKEVA
jgi:hypothetical protein